MRGGRGNLPADQSSADRRQPFGAVGADAVGGVVVCFCFCFAGGSGVTVVVCGVGSGSGGSGTVATTGNGGGFGVVSGSVDSVRQTPPTSMRWMLSKPAARAVCRVTPMRAVRSSVFIAKKPARGMMQSSSRRRLSTRVHGNAVAGSATTGRSAMGATSTTTDFGAITMNTATANTAPSPSATRRS